MVKSFLIAAASVIAVTAGWHYYVDTSEMRADRGRVEEVKHIVAELRRYYEAHKRYPLTEEFYSLHPGEHTYEVSEELPRHYYLTYRMHRVRDFAIGLPNRDMFGFTGTYSINACLADSHCLVGELHNHGYQGFVDEERLILMQYKGGIAAPSENLKGSSLLALRYARYGLGNHLIFKYNTVPDEYGEWLSSNIRFDRAFFTREDKVSTYDYESLGKTKQVTQYYALLYPTGKKGVTTVIYDFDCPGAKFGCDAMITLPIEVF